MKYGYARVSTKGQAKNGNSLEDQYTKLRAEGILEKNIFRDSCTGTKMDRPDFDRLLSILKPSDELVVCKLDRFARTAAEGSLLVQKLVKRGIKVNILNMGTADNTPMGKLMVTILLAFAEYERDMIVERTQAGKEIARQSSDYREGRPSKYTEAYEEYHERVKRGELTVKEACAELGISVSSWKRYKERV